MIEAASVPIIKLIVNLKSLRKSHGLDEAMEEGLPRSEFIPEKKAHNYKVDIAFEGIVEGGKEEKKGAEQSKIKIGIESSEYIKALIKEYTPLKPLVLVLKRFLSAYKLNTAYYGKEE